MTPVTLAHVPLLAEMHGRCFPETPWDTKAMGEILAMPGTFGFVAADGFALAFLAADVADLTTIGVLPEARRRGAGSALLGALLGEAKRRGAAQLLLEVGDENVAARNLYEKMGFKIEGLRKNYYGQGASALTMKYRF